MSANEVVVVFVQYFQFGQTFTCLLKTFEVTSCDFKVLQHHLIVFVASFSLQCHALVNDGSLALCTASEQFNLVYLKNRLYEGEFTRFPSSSCLFN